MQVAVLHGELSEAEQDYYVQLVTDKFPVSIVEKIILDVQGEYVDIAVTYANNGSSALK